MTSAKPNGINLLPRELTRSKKQDRRAPNAPLVEYTDVSEQGGGVADAQKKPRFFSRLLSIFRPARKGAQPARDAVSEKPLQQPTGARLPVAKAREKDLPAGAPLPSALFADAKKKRAAPELPAASDGIAARAVMRMHEPDFLDASLIHPAQPLPTPALMEAQEPHTHPSPEAPGAGRRAEGEPKTEPRIPTKPVQPPAPSVAAVVGQKALSGETQAPVHRVSTFDVNLLSAEYTRTFQNVNPLAVLLSWAVVTALVAGVGYGLLALYEVRATARLAEAKRVASALEETIATYEDLSAEDSVLRRKVAAAQELINDHVSWHAFLGKLEEVTIPEITYTSMAASTAGVMNITALAGDYTGLARQMVVFQETPWITDITITAATRVEESPTQPPGVSFDMSLEVSPDVLFTDARYD